MKQVKDVYVETDKLVSTKLINAVAGSLVFEDDGRVSLRADLSGGIGQEQRRLAVDPVTWSVNLLEQDDLEQRKGAKIVDLTFRVDPVSLRRTKPDGHKPGDLIVAGSRRMVVAKNEKDEPLLLVLDAVLPFGDPLTYSSWAMGVTSRDGVFTPLFY